MKTFLILFFIVPFSHVNSHAEVWTLERTVKTAIQASSARASEELKAESYLLDAREARAAYYPRLSTDARASYVSEVMEINMPGAVIRFGDNESWEQSVAVNQLIYDGGRTSNVRKTALNLRDSYSNASQAASLSAELRARRTFFNVVLANNDINASERIIEESRSHLRDAISRMNAGSALESDVLSARLRLARSEMEILEARARLTRAVAEFRSVTGIPRDSEVIVEWDESQPSNKMPIKGDILNRPELASLEARALASQNAAEAAKAGRYPQIAFTGSWNHGRPGLNMPANRWMDWFTAGIYLNWNIWDWGNINRESEKALIQREQILLERENLIREFSRFEEEAIADYILALKRVALADFALEVAESRLQSISADYRHGSATVTEYDAAAAAFASALSDRSSARALAGIAEANLDYASGKNYGGDK